MKFKLLIVAVLGVQMLIAQVNEDDQPRFRGLLIAGFNASQIDGDLFKGFNKFGFNGGIGVYTMFNQNWSVRTDIIYSQKGSRFPLNNSFNFPLQLNGEPYFERTIKLDYVEMAFTGNYHDQKFAVFNFGVSIGRQVSYSEEVFFNTIPDDLTSERDSFYSNWDISLLGGVTFYIKERYGIDLGFQRTIVPLGTLPEFVSTPNQSGPTEEKHFNTNLFLRFFFIVNK